MLDLSLLPDDAAAAPEVLWRPEFMSAARSQALMARLLEEADWELRSVNFAGRLVPVPRRTAWYGDWPYRYGGFTHPARPMPDWLQALAAEIHDQLVAGLPEALPFNSVLLNHYRDGQDSMSFHSDNELQLGPNPVIASLSLGASRSFLMRERAALAGRRRRSLRLCLSDGSLLVMHGRCQQDWEHAIPKERCQGERVNLSFRHTGPLRAGRLRLTTDPPSR